MHPDGMTKSRRGRLPEICRRTNQMLAADTLCGEVKLLAQQSSPILAHLWQNLKQRGRAFTLNSAHKQSTFQRLGRTRNSADLTMKPAGKEGAAYEGQARSCQCQG